MMLHTNKILIDLIMEFAISPFVQAQLKTFKPGDVIKSSEINENFEYLEEQIGSAGDAASAQCSATQDGSNVVISCTDGSQAVLAGARTVITYLEGGIHGQSPTPTWSTGDVVFQDANAVVLAIAEDVLDNTITYIDGHQGTFYNDPENQSVLLTGWEGGSYAYYLTEDCSEQTFLAWNNDDFHEIYGILSVQDLSPTSRHFIRIQKKVRVRQSRH